MIFTSKKLVKHLVFTCVLSTFLLFDLNINKAHSAQMSCHITGHWRDVAYDNPPMDTYKGLKQCVAWSAYQFNLPEELIYSVLYVERGSINGKCRNNRNGTQDCGPAQINDVRLTELKQFGLTKEDMKHQPCRNIWAMSYLMRREIEKADGNIWRGVGNYHFKYSVNKAVHNRYVKRIRDAWEKLLETTYSNCTQQVLH